MNHPRESVELRDNYTQKEWASWEVNWIFAQVLYLTIRNGNIKNKTAGTSKDEYVLWAFLCKYKLGYCILNSIITSSTFHSGKFILEYKFIFQNKLLEYNK